MHSYILCWIACGPPYKQSKNENTVLEEEHSSQNQLAVKRIFTPQEDIIHPHWQNIHMQKLRNVYILSIQIVITYYFHI